MTEGQETATEELTVPRLVRRILMHVASGDVHVFGRDWRMGWK